MTYAKILAHPFFASSLFVEIENFLLHLPLKNESEKCEFFTDLTSKLHDIPQALVAGQLAPLLLARMVLLDQNAVDNFLPHMLTPKGKGKIFRLTTLKLHRKNASLFERTPFTAQAF